MEGSLPWFFVGFLETDVPRALEGDELLLTRMMAAPRGAGGDGSPSAVEDRQAPSTRSGQAPSTGLPRAESRGSGPGRSVEALDEVAREVARETRGEPLLREAYALLGGRLQSRDRFPENLALFRLEGAAYRYVRQRYRLPIAGLLFPLLYLYARNPSVARARAWRLLERTGSPAASANPGPILADAVRGGWRALEGEHRRLRRLVDTIADQEEPPAVAVSLAETLSFLRVGRVVRVQRILTLTPGVLPYFDLAQYLLEHGERRPPRRCPGCRSVFLPDHVRQGRCAACRR